MRKHYLLLLTLSLVMLCASCRSSRHAAKESGVGIADVVNPDKVQANDGESFPSQGISAKLKLKLEAGGRSLTCGGTYRLKRDEVVQIDLTYSVLIVSVNVGTLVLTKDDILVIDKLSKRYCRAKYSEISAFKKEGIDFDYLQRMFWGNADKVNSSYVDLACGNWTQLSEGKFPQKMVLTLKDNRASKYKATFELSKLKETTDWSSTTRIPSGYKELPLQTVMDAIMRVAK